MAEIKTEKNKLAFSIDELAEMTSLSSAFLRNAVKQKQLKAKHFGARVLILASDWQQYAENQHDWQPAKIN